jgi:hypothetical protein
MARIKIILATLLFIAVCAIHSDKALKKDNSSQDAINSYLVERIYFHKKSKQFTFKEVNNIAYILRIAEHEFGTDPLLLIALMSHESHFYKYATGKNKKGKRVVSYDYGWTQQNSKYYKARYKRVSRILDEYGIFYNINDKYDTALNIMSAAMFLSDIKNSLMQKRQYSDFRMLANYNTGNPFPKGIQYEIAREYYLAIVRKQHFILTHAIDFDRRWLK